MFNIPRNKPYVFHILLGILLSVVIYYISNIFNIFGLTNKIPTYLSVSNYYIKHYFFNRFNKDQ